MKRILSLFLCMILILGLIPVVGVQAADPENVIYVQNYDQFRDAMSGNEDATVVLTNNILDNMPFMSDVNPYSYNPVIVTGNIVLELNGFTLEYRDESNAKSIPYGSGFETWVHELKRFIKSHMIEIADEATLTVQDSGGTLILNGGCVEAGSERKQSLDFPENMASGEVFFHPDLNGIH